MVSVSGASSICLRCLILVISRGMTCSMSASSRPWEYVSRWARIGGKDDGLDKAAVAMSDGKLRMPREQLGGETPPRLAQAPVLLKDPLERDRQRTVDDLRLADLDGVDAAHPRAEERVPLRLVSNLGLPLAFFYDFASGIGLRGGLDGHLRTALKVANVARFVGLRSAPRCSAAKDSDDRRRTWRASPFPSPLVRRAERIRSARRGSLAWPGRCSPGRPRRMTPCVRLCSPR